MRSSKLTSFAAICTFMFAANAAAVFESPQTRIQKLLSVETTPATWSDCEDYIVSNAVSIHETTLTLLSEEVGLGVATWGVSIGTQFQSSMSSLTRGDIGWVGLPPIEFDSVEELNIAVQMILDATFGSKPQSD